MPRWKWLRTKETAAAVLTLVLIVIMLLLPNPFAREIYPNIVRVSARVLTVNNDQVKSSGIIRHGEQTLTVEILQGRFRGVTADAVNALSGQLEFDKFLREGDTIFTVVDFTDDTVRHVTVVDFYRLNWELILVGVFLAILLLFARGIGLRAMLSFMFTILAIWKILIPCLLSGYDPIIIGMCVTIGLKVIIIALVYGFDRRAAAAILGSGAGTIVTGIMAIVFVGRFRIDGAVMPFSESLLYSGYQHLNLTRIFTAGIFISASGAMMDVAVDIASALQELVSKKPGLSRRELIQSGFTIGRSIMGTMATTLLLAYSGGYIGLLMVFMAQGTPIENILNLKYVSSEILHTIIGSFGLITVAPLTAITAGTLFANHPTCTTGQSHRS